MSSRHRGNLESQVAGGNAHAFQKFKKWDLGSSNMPTEEMPKES